MKLLDRYDHYKAMGYSAKNARDAAICDHARRTNKLRKDVAEQLSLDLKDRAHSPLTVGVI